MMYLEDYLEMIEHLPQELRDRFTDMREFDLQVHNSRDMIEKRVKTLFANANKTNPEEMDHEFDDILNSYNKSLEDAEEKVNLATNVHDMVEKYLRRLDSECHKFKMELEADNRGITEILEKRTHDMELAVQASSSRKENLCIKSPQIIDHGSRRGNRRDSVLSASGTTRQEQFNTNSLQGTTGNNLLNSSIAEVTTGTNPPPPTPLAQPANSTTSHPEYNLAHIGAGGTAIAAAASQAIAATQRLQHGRRSASLRASYDAISGGGVNGFGRELAGAAQTAIQASHYEAARKHKKTTAQVEMPVEDDAAAADGTANAEEEWSYDPNEPRYCYCNQVSYGDMVACDNTDCPFEWFHYPCVNVTCPPKGKWYCPQCTQTMRRRRKN